MDDNTRKPKQKRSFKFIIKFFQFVAAIVFVFFASFFITLTINSSNPKENFWLGVDLISDFWKSDEKSSAEKKTPSAQPENKKISSPRENPPLSLSQRIDRLNAIEKSVNEKAAQVTHYVAIRDIPILLVHAVISVEDAKFYSHDGFDLSGIFRAAVTNVEAGQIEEGGSTVTQQLAKNLFLSQEQSFARKAEELLLAVNIERHFSKDKIMELYLNTIYFGSNFYGIYDAAQGYFGKNPKELTLAESAMLAGLPNAPSLYSPYVNFDAAKKRQLVVLDAMLRTKAVTPSMAKSARAEEIVLVREPKQS